MGIKRGVFTAAVYSILLTGAFFLSSCSKQSSLEINQLTELQKFHRWYAFSESGFSEIELPQSAPLVAEKPWTEGIRMASAASLPYGGASVPFKAYAVVNHLGILAFTEDRVELYRDDSIFTNDTADGLVYSAGTPVFYLYRSSFFNTKNSSDVEQIQKSRPFLVEFNPSSKLCYPLVSYQNLGLSDNDQITGYFWNGKSWACSAKKEEQGKVEFNYFLWEPLLPLTDLSPALNGQLFTFTPSTEDEYKRINMPKLFSEAPQELKILLKSIPEEFSFYVSWRNTSGNSAISYFQDGSNNVPLNANAQIVPLSSCVAAVFADGTTYVMDTDSFSIKAFRLPKLPAGFSYGEFVIAGSTLYVAWEESNFYKTGRAGFISVNLSALN